MPNTIEGKLVKIEDEKVRISLSEDAKKHKWSNLYIQTKENKEPDKVEFPKDMCMAEKAFLRNQTVRYTIDSRFSPGGGHWSEPSSSSCTTYSLEVLSGQLTGEIVEERVFSR